MMAPTETVKTGSPTPVASVGCEGAPGGNRHASLQSQMTAVMDGARVSVQNSGHTAFWEASKRGWLG